MAARPAFPLSSYSGVIRPVKAGKNFNPHTPKFKLGRLMTKTIIKPPKAAPAAGPYSLGVRVGDLLFCAGQIPTVPESGQLVGADIRAQTERAIENVKI